MKAVDGVSLTIDEGETLGLVGESGCGKSTLSRTILQLTAPTSGSVRFCGEELVGRSRRSLRPVRRQMQMIFQDPYASLNPRKRVGQIIGEPMELHGLASGRDVDERVQDLLDRVGLQPRARQPLPARVLRRSAPADRHRQGPRAAARSSSSPTSPSPRWTSPCRRRSSTCSRTFRTSSACPTSSSPTTSAWSGTSRTASPSCTSAGSSKVRLPQSFTSSPLHPYSNALLSAVPIPDPKLNAARERLVLEGDVPSPIDPPVGLPLPHPLPVGDRGVRRRRPRAGRARGRSRGGLPPSTKSRRAVLN